MTDTWKNGEPSPLVEIAHCPDIVVSDIARIENLGHGNVRIVYCVDQAAEDGSPQRVIVARIVRTAASIFQTQRRVEALLVTLGFSPLAEVMARSSAAVN